MKKREYKLENRERQTYNVVDTKIVLKIDKEDFVFCLRDNKMFEKFIILLEDDL